MTTLILPGRHSQVTRLLRALAASPGAARPARWSERGAKHVRFAGFPPPGGGKLLAVHSSQVYRAVRHGWIEPTEGGFRLTATGRVTLKALEALR